jgi:hypothetical protein
MGIKTQLNNIIWAKIEKRFMDRVCISDNECWIWQGSNNGTYPTYHVLGANKTVYAHRLSYEMFNGEIESGNVVMHTCDNPLCVNPEHLTQGTQMQNMHDMNRKGRAWRPGMKQPLTGATNPAAKINQETVNAIRQEQGVSVRQLAKKYGLGASQIHRILKGHSWTQSYPESHS